MKKKTKPELMKEREDECFSCGDGGQIVSCKKPGCPKVYHADCLNLAKRPAGKYLLFKSGRVLYISRLNKKLEMHKQAEFRAEADSSSIKTETFVC